MWCEYIIIKGIFTAVLMISVVNMWCCKNIYIGAGGKNHPAKTGINLLDAFLPSFTLPITHGLKASCMPWSRKKKKTSLTFWIFACLNANPLYESDVYYQLILSETNLYCVYRRNIMSMMNNMSRHILQWIYFIWCILIKYNIQMSILIQYYMFCI